jgi:hypothetical protein
MRIKNWAKKRTNNWRNEEKELGRERTKIGEMRIKNWEGRETNIAEMRIKNWAKKRTNNWRNEDQE